MTIGGRLSRHEWFWYAGILLVAVLSLTIGYYIGIIAAVMFWAIAVLILLALRPY
jgi:hypothetical protein